jgi:anti-sigma regulatory factor (Ser/Thr protein kinase)
MTHIAGTAERVSTETAELLERHVARPRCVAVLRHAVGALAARAGATEHQRQDIALAVSEGVTNAVTHAYLCRATPGTVAVQATLHHNALEVVIADDGTGMPAPHTHPHAGRGLAIIAGAVQRLEISDAAPGTLVRMTFAIG